MRSRITQTRPLAVPFAAFFAVFLLGATGGSAQTTPHALVGARIIRVTGAAIDDGVIVFRDGKILAVGRGIDVTIPAGAQIRQINGTLMPGLVDTHSHIGGGAGGDRSNPIQPAVRIRDAIDVLDSSLHRARAGGITTVNIMPGSGHLLSGQTAYLKLRRGETIEALEIRDRNGLIAGGIKMANGTNPRGNAPFPGTRAKSAALVRQKFLAAQEYARRRAAIEKKRTEGEDTAPIARDLDLEALVDVLEGRRVVHHHTHRHDDILTVLRLREEFGFKVVLHHVSDGWKVAGEIAAARVPCSIILVDSPGGKLEAADLRFETAAALEKAGAPVAFHTDDGITDSRLFLRMAAFGIRAGMTRRGALLGVTLEAARMLELEHRVGSLDIGKDADFVLLSGDPFAVDTKVMETWVEGRRVFDRTNPEDRKFAVGGWGVGGTGTCYCDDEWKGDH